MSVSAFLQRLQEREQQRPLIRGQLLKTLPRLQRFAAVALDGVFDRRRRAVVQKWSAKAQPPQRRRPEFLRAGCLLADAVTGSDIVQEEIRKKRDALSIEQRVGARRRLERRNVAGRAADRAENSVARADGLVHCSSRDRREELHEGLEVVDTAAAGS